jgi:hypothetical protein
MSKLLPHSKIINQIAKEYLLPLGIIQKGKSRLWIDDNKWWIILLEFQPSDWGRGTYLNIGAHWLWHEKEYYSFDYGGRINPFVKYSNDLQFEEEFRIMINKLVNELMKYRSRFQNIHKVADILKSQNNLASWNGFHAGIACGLDGQIPTAKKLLNDVLQEDSFIQVKNKRYELVWHVKMKERAQYLINLLESPKKYIQVINDSILNSRKLYKLQEINVSEYN